MAFKLKSGNKPGFKQMGATKAIKQVDTSGNMHTEREIYKAKLRGDYLDLTGDKLEKASYDDPTGTVVSKDPHYLDSPAKDMKTGSYSQSFEDSPAKQKLELREPRKGELGYPVKREDLDEEGKKLWDKLRLVPEPGNKPSFEKKVKKVLDKEMKKKKSPAKQRVSDLPKNFNMSGKDTWVEKSKKILKKSKMPKNFNMTGKDKWIKQSKKLLKKGGKFVGGKTLGLLGLLMANDAYSKTDQPGTGGHGGKKSEGEQIRNLLTKHKLKGKR